MSAHRCQGPDARLFIEDPGSMSQGVGPEASDEEEPAPRGPSWPLWSGSLGLGILTAWACIGMQLTTREAGFMAGIFVLAAMLWVTEALPLFATSLLVIGLQALLLANPGAWPGFGFESGASPSFREIFSAAADPVLVLFLGGFILARAAVKEGVDRAMSALLLRPFGGKPRWILLGLMLVTMLFGIWMSNTATAAMMLALITPMLAALPPKEPFRKALVVSVPLSANISGMGTPIASPPNAVAIGFHQQAGHDIAFLDWMLVAIPLVVALTLLAWIVLWKFFPPVTEGLRLETATRKLAWRGWLVVGVFTATVLLWMSDRWHGLPAPVVALLPAVVLTMTGVFTREDLAQIDWSVLILIAGGISLGAGMQLTGLDQVVVRWLPASGGNGTWLLIALVLATLGVGTFMSNTAAANLFLPIGISSTVLASPEGGLHPVQVAMGIALAASMSMALPISTPPNAMAYARGEFTTRDLARVGLIIGGFGALAIIAGGGFIMRFWGILE
jgi:sodium-dependent dicarboxylate transporter 2/3/5